MKGIVTSTNEMETKQNRATEQGSKKLGRSCASQNTMCLAVGDIQKSSARKNWKQDINASYMLHDVMTFSLDEGLRI